MLALNFGMHAPAGLKLLFFGAHCDDIEIGCGGTVLRILRDYHVDQVRWVVFSSNHRRREEAEGCASSFLTKAGSKEITIMDYPDGFLSQHYADIKNHFEDIKKSFDPDIVFTHWQHDLHQDHRLLSELAWNTFRNHLILEYEIPKYDGDSGNPNVFINLDADLVHGKVEKLMQFYTSQQGKHWFDEETFTSIMRLRGMQSATRYAEAYYCRKTVI